MASTQSRSTPKKPRKLNKAKEAMVDMVRWDTTDAEEIDRRRVRGETETFQMEGLEPEFTYFGSYRLVSKHNKSYHVEIRSLTASINSCNCPDYAGNGLGVCKHIEHVLFRLRKLGVRRFKQAAVTGNVRTDIFSLWPFVSLQPRFLHAG